MEFILRPIGTIRSPFTDTDHMPIQASRSQAVGLVQVLPAYVAGLQDIEGFSHIILLYVFHGAPHYTLQVKPFLDDKLHGVFATRYPCRPNALGLSVVRLLARRGDQLEIEGEDVLDGTPLMDIKPYVPEFDVRAPAQIGWYSSRSRE